jgi:hypothetical protein
MLVLSAIEAFLSYVLLQEEGDRLLRCISAVKDEIQKINIELAGNDYELVFPAS